MRLEFASLKSLEQGQLEGIKNPRRKGINHAQENRVGETSPLGFSL